MISYHEYLTESSKFVTVKGVGYLQNSIKVPRYWYHGSNNDFDQFDASKMQSNFPESYFAVYFSDSENVARNFIDMVRLGGKSIKHTAAFIYKCELNFKRVYLHGYWGDKVSNWIGSDTKFLDDEDIIKQNILKFNAESCIVYDQKSHSKFTAATNDTSIIHIVDKIKV